MKHTTCHFESESYKVTITRHQVEGADGDSYAYEVSGMPLEDGSAKFSASGLWFDSKDDLQMFAEAIAEYVKDYMPKL